MAAFVIAGVALVGALSLTVVTPGLVSVAYAQGTVITVTTTADNTTDDANCSLREAIDYANDPTTGNDECGDGSADAEFTIVLTASTYTLTGANSENLNASGDLDIELTAANDILNIQGNGARIDANGVDRVFDINPDDTDTIDVNIYDLTITGGDVSALNQSGGGILALDTDLWVEGSTIAGNKVSTTIMNASGGGIYIGEGSGTGYSLTITNSVIGGPTAADGNAAYYGGGIYANYIDAGETAKVTITNSVIQNNVTSSNDGYGGGIYFGGGDLDGAVLTVKYSTISDNSAGQMGGGIYNDEDMTAVIDWSHILTNTAGYGGGGIALYEFASNSPVISIHNTIIQGNTAGSDTMQIFGGGLVIWVDAPIVDIWRSQILDNVSDNLSTSGGEGWSGGIDIYSYTSGGKVTIRESLIDGNQAKSGSGGTDRASGGGLVLWGYLDEAHISDTTISNNVADASDGGGGGDNADSGGVFVGDGAINLIITNTTISGNRAEGGDGWNGAGGINVWNVASAQLSYVTIAGNHADDDTGGIYNNDTTTTLYATIVTGNTAGTADTKNCLFATPIAGTSADNISEDNGTANGCDSGAGFTTGTAPLVGPLADNGGPTQTHLPQGAAIDGVATAGLCNGTIATDQRGVPRPIGTNCDIGAVEVAVADLTITKTLTSGDASPAQDDTVVFEVEVGNSGTGGAYEVEVEDALSDPAITWTGSGATSGVFSTTTGLWTDFDVAAGDTETLWITGTVQPDYGGETITNTATISDFLNSGESTGLGEWSSAGIMPSLVTLTIHKSAAPTPATDEETAYTIFVENTSAYTAHNIVITDSLPVSFTVTDTDPTPDSEDPHTWILDTLGAGETATVVITGTFSEDTIGETINNVAYASADDEGATTPLSSEPAIVTPVEPAELSLSKSASTLTPRLGEEFAYRLAVDNTGTTAETVVVTDAIDSRLTYNRYTTQVLPAISHTVSYTNGVVTWTAQNLPAGEDTALYIFVTPNYYTTSLVITNTAYLIFPLTDSDSATTTIGKARIYLPVIMKNQTN
jgi:CSLREA domain-containing protein/uncharacterized repeat protein (TIGR01451 family)